MTTRPVSPRIQALKVLIVDDEHYMRKVTRTILTAIGVKTILEAPDGMAGLELARTQLPHLLIIDWEMPVIDGSKIKVQIPKGCQNGHRFRLKGQGMPRLKGEDAGDLYARARVILPAKLDDETAAAARELLDKVGQPDPRASTT